MEGLYTILPLPWTPRNRYHPTFFRGEQGCSTARKETPLIMQSSAAVAGRALIMLACVVGIPALALSGTSWSDMLKKLQEFHWPALLELASGSASAPAASSGEAPRFVTPGPSVSAIVSSTPQRVVPSDAALRQPLAPVQSAVVPAGYQEVAAVTPPVVGTANANAAAAPASDPFDSIQKRLKQLGATYYLLESWGTQQQMYRFYCKMAVGGSADYTRYFEATSADPLQAMVQVLREVEAWRESGGRQAEVAVSH
jgi:hypothetical protein